MFLCQWIQLSLAKLNDNSTLCLYSVEKTMCKKWWENAPDFFKYTRASRALGGPWTPANRGTMQQQGKDHSLWPRNWRKFTKSFFFLKIGKKCGISAKVGEKCNKYRNCCLSRFPLRSTEFDGSRIPFLEWFVVLNFASSKTRKRKSTLGTGIWPDI